MGIAGLASVNLQVWQHVGALEDNTLASAAPLLLICWVCIPDVAPNKPKSVVDLPLATGYDDAPVATLRYRASEWQG
jgi:hypothetical protein